MKSEHQRKDFFARFVSVTNSAETIGFSSMVAAQADRAVARLGRRHLAHRCGSQPNTSVPEQEKRHSAQQQGDICGGGILWKTAHFYHLVVSLRVGLLKGATLP